MGTPGQSTTGGLAWEWRQERDQASGPPDRRSGRANIRDAATAATAIAGGLAAAISLLRRERSLQLLPVLVWGAVVLLFSLGEPGGHGHP